jgi:glycosidase
MRQTEYHFHVSRKGRNQYQLEDRFFTIRGNAVFTNFAACQEFSAKVNANRKARGVSDRDLVRTAEVFAAALMHEVFHFVISVYLEDANPDAFAKCEGWIRSEFGEETTTTFLQRFVDEFPTMTVYRGDETVEQYLSRTSDGTPNTQVALEELMLVWLENQNPALNQLEDLIDDESLVQNTPYNQVITSVDNFFATQPTFGVENLPLLRLLLAPIKAAPNSILEQLKYVIEKWDAIISRSPSLKKLLLQSLDFVKEEGKYFMMLEAARAEKERMPSEVRQAQFFGDYEKETPPVADYKSAMYEEAPENFTPDVNWMPRLVLMAKNTYVWLDQLSKTYQRPIKRLDEIPDEELDTLARRGFTGLWLIGLWERSYASKRIKHLNGNIDAIASAYSLDDYVIAKDLGGYEAYANLKERARRKGVRLASDMVPNHMGIDSKWVIHHPEWFLQVDYPPFPNYTFHGTDLSPDPRIGIFIEDGYWRKTDAAVVFARLDRWTGEVRYIYHGNDGTNMPWNDTAQLNFLKPEVREQVIQTILNVARMFPIIRFDAAMVLAKQHIQRLWFPEPGKGGAIPSRAAFAMTKEEFDRAMPVEFWREVVDRVQQEVPDTLLLAEAFWMLEGYFVRTLGMHRVYNSAFMHMFKKEENAEYHKLIKDTLEYDPRILKRYVNFMNNPDEETAVKQFGKGDKYFGVCVMMCTMPGLPMFGHGQIEGFTEKYGMEYQRAYYNETPDEWLVARHEREIFPLLKKRYLFAEVDNFLLYDFITPHGIDNNVFAYSNRYNDEKALVIYHNKYAETSGWIKTASKYLDIDTNTYVVRTLGEGLMLSKEPNTFVIFRDAISGLEYIRSNREVWEKGMYFDLHAYKYQVLLDFQEVKPSVLFPYDELARQLGNAGVPSIKDAVLELSLRPLHAAVQEAFSPETLVALYEHHSGAEKLLKEKVSAIREAMLAVQHDVALPKSIVDETVERYRAYRTLQEASKNKKFATTEVGKHIANIMFPEQANGNSDWRILLGWTLLNGFNQIENPHANNLMSDFRLSKFVSKSLEQLGLTEERAKNETDLMRIMLDFSKSPSKAFTASLYDVLEGRKANVFLGVNQYEGIVYFNKEKFERLLEAFFALSALETVRKENLSEKTLAPIFSLLKTYSELATAVGYKYNDLLSKLTEALKPKEEPTDTQLTPSKPKSTTSVTAKKAKAKEVETELHFSDEMKKGMAESLTTVEKGKATAKKAKAKKVETELHFSDEMKKGMAESLTTVEKGKATAKKAEAKKVETELHFSDEMKKGMAESLTTVEKGKATAKKAKAKKVETELHFSDEMKKGMAESLTTVEKGKATAKKAKAKETVVEASSKTVVKSKTEKPTITRLSNKSGTKITSSKTAQTKTTSAKTTTKKTQTKQVAKKGETIKRITTAKATTSKTPTKKK